MSATTTAITKATNINHAEIISQVVSDIEKFLDFTSILRLSLTCHSLYDALVDTASSEDGTPKLKVSYFTTCDPSLLRDTTSNTSSSSPSPAATTTTTTTNSSLAYYALTKLHFPSLKRLDLLPMVVGEWREQCFQYMAMHIGEACQLEKLDMDVKMVIANDFKYSSEPVSVSVTSEAETRALPSNGFASSAEDNSSSSSTAIIASNNATLYDHFACNLARLKKLRILKIMNYYLDVGEYNLFPITSLSNFSYYGIGFLHAFTPLIQAHILLGNQGGLEEVTLNLGNAPAPPRESTVVGAGGDEAEEAAAEPEFSWLTYPSWSDNAALDFFTAVLSLQSMKEFNMQLDLASSTLLNDFLAAADIVHQQFGYVPSSMVLQSSSVVGTLYKPRMGVQNPLPQPLSLFPCLALLGNCPNLHTFMVRLPPSCWDDDGLTAAQQLMQNKPNMRTLGLYFHDYQCTNSQIANSLLKTLLQYLKERENKYGNLIIISCLHFSDDDDADVWEDSLDRFYTKEAMKCLIEDEHGLNFRVIDHFVEW